MSQSKYISVGIDPGESSCGVSVVLLDKDTSEAQMLFCKNFVPKESLSAFTFIEDKLFREIKEIPEVQALGISYVVIERFVAYAGVSSSASEEILMLIGALRYAFESNFSGVIVRMVRAFDWKSSLCKYLVRTSTFRNEQSSFDKKFSLQTAKHLFPSLLKITTHEADAACIGFMPVVEEYERRNKKNIRKV